MITIVETNDFFRRIDKGKITSSTKYKSMYEIDNHTLIDKNNSSIAKGEKFKTGDTIYEAVRPSLKYSNLLEILYTKNINKAKKFMKIMRKKK
jgi:hypothetical protein